MRARHLRGIEHTAPMHDSLDLAADMWQLGQAAATAAAFVTPKPFLAKSEKRRAGVPAASASGDNGDKSEEDVVSKGSGVLM